jgi:hypothetical protein
MAGKLTRIVAGTVVALSATALFTVAATAISSASPRDDKLLLDAQVTIDQSTFADTMAPGASYTTFLSVVDNVSGDKGDGSGQCAVVGKDKDGTLISRCLTILRLPAGEITINGMFTRKFPATYKGAILGGTGAFKDITGEADMTRPDAKTIQIKIAKSATQGAPGTPAQPAAPAVPVAPAEPATPAEPGVPAVNPSSPG